jgi:hypothetical protein
VIWTLVKDKKPAPLEKVLVLVKSKHEDKPYFAIAEYIPERYITDEDYGISVPFNCLTYDKANDCNWLREGFIEVFDQNECGRFMSESEQVTHWTALPRLPKEDKL